MNLEWLEFIYNATYLSFSLRHAQTYFKKWALSEKVLFWSIISCFFVEVQSISSSKLWLAFWAVDVNHCLLHQSLPSIDEMMGTHFTKLWGPHKQARERFIWDLWPHQRLLTLFNSFKVADYLSFSLYSPLFNSSFSFFLYDSDIHESALFWNLKKRYEANKIYVRTSLFFAIMITFVILVARARMSFFTSLLFWLFNCRY